MSATQLLREQFQLELELWSAHDQQLAQQEYQQLPSHDFTKDGVAVRLNYATVLIRAPTRGDRKEGIRILKDLLAKCGPEERNLFLLYLAKAYYYDKNYLKGLSNFGPFCQHAWTQMDGLVLVLRV
eukprot:gnl/Spiro4/1225_TR650_c0_g1_i1.p1 gnl/Spiro4/1225_TR650_c0_g1~~gnl/Spiro4/1225_TR650_c0_g1_i1.p1  ORF type:complete len:126 (-),score=12.57 gnl/Spiro4/1225_TR650_c0_g1_i1:117-494(-)